MNEPHVTTGELRDSISTLYAEVLQLREVNKDMLAALEEAMEFLSNGTPIYPGALVQASIFNAIAKAKGQ